MSAATSNPGKVTAFDVSPRRMRMKKFVRRLAIGLGRLVRDPDAPADGSVRVLTYHRFGESPLDPCCVHPRSFETQAAWLSAHANVLTPAKFDAVMSGESQAPRNAILITIDDGHASVAEHALPVLDRHGFKAVLFVCPLLASAADGRPENAGVGFMDWPALASAMRNGHAIGAHGHSHRSLGRMPLAEAIAEIDQALASLQARIGVKSPFFSFPFGTRLDHSPALAAALAQRGLRYCFTAEHGRCRPGSGSIIMPRIKIEGGNEDRLFPDIARGCIDHWRFVDQALYLLQQRGRM